MDRSKNTIKGWSSMNNCNNKKINDKKAILDYNHPLDYALLMEYLEIFTERYYFMDFQYIGKSIMGRKIPMIRLGYGSDRSLLYVGAHHGMEWITSIILLRFINEFCEIYKGGRTVYGLDLAYLYNTRSIYIVPMLNPDGVDYQINGLSPDNPIRERLIAMNGGSSDFSSWQANGRGVDLNHNYNYGFMEYKAIEQATGIINGAPTRYSGECPESEPEVSALCNIIRTCDIKMILTLHSQGEEIYYTSGGKVAPRSESIVKLLAKMSGYTPSSPEGMASFGGLTDWYIHEFNQPSFTIECGKGKNPLPLEDYFPIYMRLREVLFTSPIIM